MENPKLEIRTAKRFWDSQYSAPPGFLSLGLWFKRGKDVTLAWDKDEEKAGIESMRRGENVRVLEIATMEFENGIFK